MHKQSFFNLLGQIGRYMTKVYIVFFCLFNNFLFTQKPLSEGESDTGNQTQKWAEVSKSHVYSALKDSMSYTYCCLGLCMTLPGSC